MEPQPALVFLESDATATEPGVDLMEIAAEPLQGARVEGNVLRGVRILGFESQNPTLGYPTVYTAEAMARAVPLYEGAPVHLGHPPRDNPAMERAYQDRIGSVKGVHLAKDGLRGDLQLNPDHPVTKQLLWDAKNAPNNVGLSHNARGDGAVANGRYAVSVLNKVHGVDVVTRPSTTRGLFESVDDTKKKKCPTCGHAMEDDVGADAKKVMESVASGTLITPPKAPDTSAEKKLDVALMESRMLAAEEAAKSATARLAVVEGELAIAKKKGTIATLAAAAKLPASAMTPLFESVLMEAKDEATIKLHIEERARYVTTGTQLVESRAPGAPPAKTGSSVPVTDAKSFAKALGV